VAGLIDTIVIVYRFDPRFPRKQRIATELLRQGIIADSVRIPHQAIVEFVSAVTRPLGKSGPLLSLPDGLREAEELLVQFRVLYPNEQILRLAVRGAAAYQLPWYDAHMWAYAEYYRGKSGTSELFTRLWHPKTRSTARTSLHFGFYNRSRARVEPTDGDRERISGRLRMQTHTERAGHFQHSGEARVAVLAKRLI